MRVADQAVELRKILGCIDIVSRAGHGYPSQALDTAQQ